MAQAWEHSPPEVAIMRTTIVIGDDLIDEAMQVTGIKTKREVVDTALRMLVSLERQRSLLELVQFCGITQHAIMFSCSAKLLKHFANSRAKHVADLRSEILEGTVEWQGELGALRQSRLMTDEGVDQ